MPASLSSFIDAASDAIAREVANLRREAQREKELRDAEHRALLAEIRLAAAGLYRQIEERLETLKDGAPGKDGRDGSDGKDGRDGIDGKDGAPGADGANGKDGEPGPDGKDGRDGDAGKDGRDGKDIDPSEIGAVWCAIEETRSALADLETVRADNDLSDREFERRVDALLAGGQMQARQNGDHAALEMVRDAVVGAMREVPRPTVNVTVPISMPKRGKEIMTVEHDARGRIKRSVKEEVD